MSDELLSAVSFFYEAFFFIWGSFLNVVAYRLITQKTLFGRSMCTQCNTPIAWYDLVPILSFFMLRGHCRNCRKSISWLYPFIEIITVILMSALYWTNDYFMAYFILFSALIVTIRTDLEYMLISPWMTLALIPIGIILSITDHLPIIPLDSILGAGVGFFSLFFIGTIFTAITGKEGIGQGDFDLFGLIGAFTGLLGIWVTLLISSISASIFGITYLLLSGGLRRNVSIPFGPFLALGAILYVLFQEFIIEVLFCNHLFS